jgi:biopolymer transport protein ExbD
LGFGTASSQGDEPGFQLAPMIDVVFQLLIFFLLATSFQKFEAKINSDLPQQQQEEPDKPPKQTIVKVTADGLLVNNIPMKKREFALRMATLMEYDANQFVFIDGSDDALHNDVIEIFDTLNQMGISVTVIPPYEKQP